ncbi:MAG: RICIN domain-containing protein [Phycicoccus sp.]
MLTPTLEHVEVVTAEEIDMHENTYRHEARTPSPRRRPHRTGRALVVAAAAAAATIAAVIVGAPTAAASTTYTRFELSVNRWAINTGFDGGTTVNGADAVTWSWMHRDPHDHNSQWRQLDAGSSGWYQYQNRWSNQCLDVEGTGIGADVEQAPCDGSAGQQWRVVHVSVGSSDTVLVNRWATDERGRFMVATASGTDIGAQVMLSLLDGRASQLWTLGGV